MSSRVTRLKSQKFQDNIAAKRGTVAAAETAEVRVIYSTLCCEYTGIDHPS